MLQYAQKGGILRNLSGDFTVVNSNWKLS